MNTVGSFRQYKDEADIQRGDPFEGIAGLFQPSRIGVLKIGDCEISAESLAAPVLIHTDASLSRNVFCMYALHSRGWAPTVSAETVGELKATLEMHHSCFSLGSDLVVVLDVGGFQSRLKAAIKKNGFGATANLVEYFDESQHHGWFEPGRAAFMKRNRYAHQKEWRIVLDRRVASDEPYTLEIGDLRDITTLTKPEEFNEKLELVLPDGTRA